MALLAHRPVSTLRREDLLPAWVDDDVDLDELEELDELLADERECLHDSSRAALDDHVLAVELSDRICVTHDVATALRLADQLSPQDYAVVSRRYGPLAHARAREARRQVRAWA